MDEDLRIGEAGLLRGVTAAKLFGCTAGAGDYVCAYRTAFGFVSVEVFWRGLAVNDESHFPAEVVGVLDAGVHALAASGGTDVGGGASEESTAFAVAPGEAHPDAEVWGPLQIGERHLHGEQSIGDGLQLRKGRCRAVGL